MMLSKRTRDLLTAPGIAPLLWTQFGTIVESNAVQPSVRMCGNQPKPVLACHPIPTARSSLCERCLICRPMCNIICFPSPSPGKVDAQARLWQLWRHFLDWQIDCPGAIGLPCSVEWSQARCSDGQKSRCRSANRAVLTIQT